jgi:hypothetical protein
MGYVKQFDEQENRIAAMKIDKENLEAERETARGQLGEFIRQISIDRRL